MPRTPRATGASAPRPRSRVRAGVKKFPWPRRAARLLRLLHTFHEFGHLWTLLDTPCPNLTLAVRVSFSRPTYIFGHFGYFCVYFCKEEEETVRWRALPRLVRLNEQRTTRKNGHHHGKKDF